MKKIEIFIRYFVILMLIATFMACASTPTRESTGEYVDDSVITTKVKSLLAEDDFLKSFKISVETFKGVVQLSGFVNSQQAVDKAGQITRSVKGVSSVKNNLIVKLATVILSRTQPLGQRLIRILDFGKTRLEREMRKWSHSGGSRLFKPPWLK